MLRGLAFILMLIAAVASAQQDQGLYLHVLPVSTRAAADGEPPGVTLRVSDAAATAAALSAYGLTVRDTTATSVVLSLRSTHTTMNGAPDALLRDSFVVDYAEPSVQSMLQAQPWHAQDAPPPLNALTQSVFEWINDKNYSRGFDFASTAARTQSGDCTEHAALLAAISRATGRPARIVFGVLMIGAEQPQAFGHAWTEVWDQDGWHVLDATMPESMRSPESIYYLPLGVLENETAAYTLSYLNILERFPSEIDWHR